MEKKDLDKAIPLQLIKKKEPPLLEAAPVNTAPKDDISPKESLAVTIAAFVLNSEHRTTDINMSFENQNTKDVRDEILKAVREEGERPD